MSKNVKTNGKKRAKSLDKQTLTQLNTIKSLITEDDPDGAWELIQSLNNPHIYEGLLEDCPVDCSGFVGVPRYFLNKNQETNNEELLIGDLFIKILANLPKSARVRAALTPPTKLDMGISVGTEWIDALPMLPQLSGLKIWLLILKESDLRAFAQIPRLRELNMSSCEIPDMKGLGSFSQLTHLDLEECYVNDVSVLKDFTKLKELNLQQNKVTDVSALAGCKKLEKLNLTINEVKDVSPLAKLRKLKDLHLSCNQDLDLSSLSRMSHLEGLSLAHNQITDVKALAGLIQLKFLDLDCNEITDVRHLANLTKLEELSIDCAGGGWEKDNEITDVSALAGLKKLKVLSLLGNPIADVSPLAKLTKLQRLELTAPELADARPLAGLNGLTDFCLNQSMLTDANDFAKLTKLKKLHLGYNLRLADVSALANLEHLTNLDLWDNPKLTKAQVDKLQKALPKCRIHFIPTKR